MNFDGLKNLLNSFLEAIFYKIKDSLIFNILLEKYESLDLHHQRWIYRAFIISCFVLIFSFPLTIFISSTGSLQEFKYKKDLVFDLIKNQKSSLPKDSIDPFQFEQNINNVIENQSLSPNQVVQISNASQKINIPKAFQKLKYLGKEIRVEEINIKDVISLGQQLENMDSAVKLVGFKIEERSDKENYYNTVFTLIYFNPPASKKKITPLPSKTPPPLREKDV